MFFFFFCSFINCWWNGPHEIIALVAARSMSTREKEAVNTIINTWESEPGNISSIASWFDSITYAGSNIKICKHWHYIDTPIADESVLKVQKEFHTEYNVTNILNDVLSSLYNETTTSYWALNFNFRALLHFIGDVHQPLHASERYTLKGSSVSGDGGGNAFYISTDSSSIKNLHYLWDSAIFAYQYGPFTDSMANDLISEIGSPKKWYNLTLLESLDPMVWAQESYAIANNSAYNLQMNEYVAMDSEYAAINQPLAKKQIILCAYRLNKIFEKFFNIERKPYKVIVQPTENKNAMGIAFWAVDGVLGVVSIVYIVLLFRVPKNKKEEIAERGRLNQTLLTSLM